MAGLDLNDWICSDLGEKELKDGSVEDGPLGMWKGPAIRTPTKTWLD